MIRDIFKFLAGMAAAASFGHIAYAVAALRGVISIPVWRGREWGVGKLLIEAVVYAMVGAGLGYLGWRKPRTIGSRSVTHPTAAVVRS